MILFPYILTPLFHIKKNKQLFYNGSQVSISTYKNEYYMYKV